MPLLTNPSQGGSSPGTAPAAPLLEIADLALRLPGAARPLLDSVSLTVEPGEVVALVGESGSGKSTTAKAALGVLPPGATATGRVRFDGTDVLALDDAGLRAHRAGPVAMVHQDPRAALNPVRRIGDFLRERGASRERAVQLLADVGLSDPERRLRQRPHELSGGMLQRVVIAGALAAEPRLLLADEATSALDVTTQAEILALLRTLRADRDLGMLFITHDLHLAAAYCDRVHVMYAGHVVEHRTADALFGTPAHPYTRGLLACSPSLGDDTQELAPIPGRPPSLADTFTGCPFVSRCDAAEDACPTWHPAPRPLPDGGSASCVHIPHPSGTRATPGDVPPLAHPEVNQP
ncbi:ABC transporter ATP-binding protein [Streptomyces sp. LHD-70]|uniref:ABC transporter ATP-binding protein n=1 Tax=Streptomyces sp. LHD-70 TaxID=3072140 RepID=UPI002810241B|nr:ABC transporter ATP-binding protein [Streptomyces sp. LHD-70]MDQ8705125.1 ABC transporter ATP-binding protein [Streptomyces sp. LHD-70]